MNRTFRKMLLPIVLLSFHSRPAGMHTNHLLSTTHWLSISKPIFHLKKRMISPNPFFYDKSSKYCYGSECDLMNDVNSSNSSNLRNTVLSVNCRLYIAAKFLLVCDPIFFMNKYDTLKNWWVPIQLTFNQNSMYQVRLSRGIVCFKILISEGKKTICHYEIKIRDNN